MRVLFLIHNYPPHNIGGVELYTSAVVDKLCQQAEIAVAYPVQDPSRESLSLVQRQDAHGNRLYEITGAFHNIWALNFVADHPQQKPFMAILNQILDDVQPHVVHLQHLLGYPVLAVLQELKNRNLPIIYTMSDHWFVCPRVHALRSNLTPCTGPEHGLWTCAACMTEKIPLRIANPILAGANKVGLLPLATRLLPAHSKAGAMMRRDTVIQAAFPFFDHLLSPCESLIERLVAWGLPGEKMQYVPYGNVLPEHVAPPRQRRMGEPLKIGYLGAFVPGKGPHVVVEAARLLFQETGKQFIFYFHGSGKQGKYTSAIEKQASDLPNALLMGRYARSDLDEIMSNLDCVVVPSLWYETSSFVISEAFLHLVPVVTSDLGAMRERVNGGSQGGIVFEPGNPRALADTLLRLQQEPRLLEELRRTIPPVTLVFDHVQTLLEIYEHHIAEKQNINGHP